MGGSSWIRNEKVQAHVALSAVALFYGLNYVVAKDVLVKEFMTPSGFIMLRVLAGSLIFSIVHTLFIREKMEYSDTKYALFCSAFGAMINMLCFFEGLKHTSPIHASLIMVLTPILVLLISAILIKEKITLTKLIGIFLGLVGAVILVSGGGNSSDQGATLYGDLMIMVNAISYGIYLVLVRRLTKKYHPVTVIKWIFIFGSILIFPFGGRDLYETNFNDFPSSIWYSVMYVLFFATSGTYLLNAFALSRVLPSTVGFYVYFQPVIATVLSILIYNEILDIKKGVAAGLIFLGVYLINKMKKNTI